MKLIIEVPTDRILQVKVPDYIYNCEVLNCGYAGTWLQEFGRHGIDDWRIKLPTGRYEVIGRVETVVYGFDQSEIKPGKNFLLRYI